MCLCGDSNFLSIRHSYMAPERAAAYEMLRGHEAHCRQHGLSRFRILELGDAVRCTVQMFTGSLLSSPVAILPCFSSVARRRLKASTSPSAVKPMGSQNPKGACSSSSVRSSTEAVVISHGKAQVEDLKTPRKDQRIGACTPSSFSKALTTTFRVVRQRYDVGLRTRIIRGHWD